MVQRIVLLVLFFSASLLTFSSRAQESSNPYIYYFSDRENAFIIERADGTDTHILGDGLMALTGNAHDIYVDGPGWSPSGQWFAWTASQISNSGYSGSSNRPYVVSIDGSHRLTLLDPLQNVDLKWAKNTDLLFVASSQVERLNQDDPNDTHSRISIYLAVIDVASATVISSFEDATLSDYNPYRLSYFPPPIVQTSDGDHVIVSYVDYEGGASFDGTAVVVVLDTTGTITEKRLDDFGPISIDGNYYRYFPSISAAGWVVYPTEDSFRLDNVLTGEEHTLAPLDAPQQIMWDASGSYAVITDGNLWLLDCSTVTLTLLRENWGFGELSYRAEQPVWSPDSHYALLLDGDTVLSVLNRETGSLTDLPVTAENRYPGMEWYWLDNDVVIYHTSEPALLIYDLGSFTALPVDVELSPYTHPRLSSDRRYVAFMNDGAAIYDTVTDTYQRIRPDYNSFNSVSGVEITWNDTDEWLLIFDDALVAGGANIRFLDIVRADGSLRRDLGFSWGPNSITLNWLPPQVDPTELPPALHAPLVPQPDSVLRGSQWSFYVDWSPDGRWIAAGLGWDSDGDITVWDVHTGDVVHVFEDAQEDQRVLWPQAEEFVPELYIPEEAQLWRTNHILARSPDGHEMVQTNNLANDLRTQVVDTDTGTVLAELSGEWDSYFESASYSPDGRLLAAANPYTPVRIWNTSTWELITTMPNPGQAVAFSPDGTQLAVSASWDVQIWSVEELLADSVQ